MLWTSRRENRPNFIWRADRLLRAEWIFASESRGIAGVARNLGNYEQSQVAVRMLSDDTVSSFAIDGEELDGVRMEAAVRRCLGLAFLDASDGVAEMGAARLAVSSLQGGEIQLSDSVPLGWRDRFEAVLFPGAPGVMEGVSAEAGAEFGRFWRWYGEMLGEEDSPLLRAGLAHLWFESIHPFSAATGVVGRAMAERVLSSSGSSRNFVPLSLVFGRYRHSYHRELDDACRDRDAGRWLLWFSAAAIEAVRVSRARLEFALACRGLMARLENRVSRGQHLILRRLFGLGVDGFRVGIGVGDCGVGRVEACRDLAALVEGEALVGVRRGGEWRYRLNVGSPEVGRVYPEDIV